MDNLRKAAIVLLSLDKPLAARVLAEMPRSMVESITLEIARIGDVTREQQQSVFDQFFEQAGERTDIERGGIDTVSDLLNESLGEEGADIIENVRQTMSSVPFGFLHKQGADNLVTFIVEEHPQTIALVMSHLPAAMAAEVLGNLSAEKQIDVIQRISAMEQTSQEVVRDVEMSLQKRMKSTFNQQLEKAGGVPLVAQILNVTDRVTNKTVLDSLDENNSELAEEIRRLMFVFDDILKLDDRSMQRVLKEVDNSQWSVALKGASEEFKNKVLGNMSQRAAEALQEDMGYLGPVRVSDVEAMQQQIVDIVRGLEETGEIEVAAAGDGGQMIV